MEQVNTVSRDREEMDRSVWTVTEKCIPRLIVVVVISDSGSGLEENNANKIELS